MPYSTQTIGVPLRRVHNDKLTLIHSMLTSQVLENPLPSLNSASSHPESAKERSIDWDWDFGGLSAIAADKRLQFCSDGGEGGSLPRLIHTEVGVEPPSVRLSQSSLRRWALCQHLSSSHVSAHLDEKWRIKILQPLLTFISHLCLGVARVLHELRCSRMPVIFSNVEELGGVVIGRYFFAV